MRRLDLYETPRRSQFFTISNQMCRAKTNLTLDAKCGIIYQK